jgi:hypothetical protein
MTKYVKATWRYVLDAAKEFNGKPFAPIDIINKIHKENPSIKANTIRCHIFGMTPNHPSSKYYPSLLKNHPVLDYLGNGQFKLLVDQTRKPNNNGPRVQEWEQLKEKIVNLQSEIALFNIEFFDRDTFKKFCDNLQSNLRDLKEISITGYFSETIRAELESLVQNDFYHVRLISPDFSLGTPRDKKNLEALRKLSEAGAEVKFNSRLHARLLAASNSIRGLLVLGSFDFNTECIGKERYDAGIKTTHPDLVRSAIDFFEQVWIDSGTITLAQFLKEKKIISSTS